MKKTETKEIVKSTEFANTIYRIRQERKLTQKDLGEIIGVSDRTISKWENGTTVPDLCQIRNICRKLEISPSLLIKSEKIFKDGMTDLKRKVGKILNYLLHNIFLIGFIIVFILLLLYFINNFNAVKIYNLKFDSENIYLNHGYFFKTKTVNILTIENIELRKIDYEPTEVEVELYTYVNGDKKVLYISNTLNNIYLEENKSGTDLLTRDTIESLKKNLHLTIKTKDVDNVEQSYDCKIELVNKFSNDKLSYTQFVKDSKIDVNYLSFQNLSLFSYDKNLENTEIALYSLPKSKNSLEDLGYIYDKNNDVYTKVDSDGGIIEYIPKMNLIKYLYIDNNILKIDINTQLNKINIIITNSNHELLYEIKLSLNENYKKYLGKFNKIYLDKITYIIGVYNEINRTL